MKVFFSLFVFAAVSAIAMSISNQPAMQSLASLTTKANKTVALAQLETSLSQVKTQATFLNKLAQSLTNIQKFNAAVEDHNDNQTIKSLAEAFKHASKAAESLAQAQKGAQKTAPHATELAQSESSEG